jgi:RHS repeat-associated protein
VISRTIAKPGTVGGSTSEAYTYDGLGRVKTAENDFSLVTRSYDSRGNLVSETLNADAANSFPALSDRTVQTEYDTADNIESCTYPGAARTVYHTHDGLNRLAGLWEDSSHTDLIAGYTYTGPGRVQTRTSGNGVVASYEYNGMQGVLQATGDNGFRQVTEIRHERGATLLEGRAFTWDKAGNKTSHVDLRTSYSGRRERAFGYDGLNRLVETQVTYPGIPSQNGTATYTLDGVHNRTAVTGSEDAGAAVGTYTQNAANASLNQYTTVPAMPSDNATLETYEYLYDESGNVGSMLQFPRHGDLDGDYDRDLSDITLFTAAFQNEEPAADLNGDGVWDASDLNLFIGSPESYEHVSLVYDWRNQLVGFLRSNGTDELVSAEYRYDCFNRRIASIIDLDGDGTDDETPHFVYGGQAAWQLFEEYNGPGSTATRLRSYVYGNYIDEVLQMRDHPSGEDFYFHQDDLFSVYAMTDDDGVGDVVVERYEYGDYGQVRILTPGGADRPESLLGNRHTFTGRLLDDEMTLAGGEQVLQYRHRYMTTGSGRFLQRDPLLYAYSLNTYAFVLSNPSTYIDPSGLLPMDPPPSLDPGHPDNVLDRDWRWRAHCKKVRDRIRKRKDEIEKRKREYEEDKHKLPDCHYDDWKSPRKSRRGHRNIIEDLEENLRDLEENYRQNRCDGGPPKRPLVEPVPPLRDKGVRPKPRDPFVEVPVWPVLPGILVLPKTWPKSIPVPSFPVPSFPTVPIFVIPPGWGPTELWQPGFQPRQA